jgi:septum formation protein
MHPRLILASGSRARRALFDRLGLAYDTIEPHLDPTSIPGGALTNATFWAERKARALQGNFADAVIVGAHRLLEMDGEMLPSPTTEASARSQLGRLAGSTHRVHAAVAVYNPATDLLLSEAVVVELTMRTLTPEQIARYVTLDRPHALGVSYLYDRTGSCLFQDVKPHDESAILGLPLLPLCRLLRELGADPLAE